MEVTGVPRLVSSSLLPRRGQGTVPRTARSTANKVAQLVKTMVGRAMQVAMVKGLNRKLQARSAPVHQRGMLQTYAALTARLLHRVSLRGDVKSLDEPASPESAREARTLAHSRSTTTYKMLVATGCLGKSAKRGSRSGAWHARQSRARLCYINSAVPGARFHHRRATHCVCT